jgi:hypothetical protein
MGSEVEGRDLLRSISDRGLDQSSSDATSTVVLVDHDVLDVMAKPTEMAMWDDQRQPDDSSQDSRYVDPSR